MSVNSLYSLDYFNFLGLAHADKNKNGEIDDDEKSIFDEFLKQFDMNKNGKVEEDDVPLYRQSVEYTDNEIKAQKESEEFNKSHGIYPGMSSAEIQKVYSNLTKEEQTRYKDILSRRGSVEKMINNINDEEYRRNSFKYLLSLKDSIRYKIFNRFDCIKKMVDDVLKNSQ